MRFFCAIIRYLLLVILCLWLVAPSLSSDVLCLTGENQPRLRKRNESFSSRAVADAAQARAYLSPAVFLGTLRSVLVQRDGTVRAWFAIDTILKMPNDTASDGGNRSSRSSRMASYSKLYARNRYTRDPVSLPALRPRYWPGYPAYTRAVNIYKIPQNTKPPSTSDWTSPDQPLLISFRRRTRTLNKRPEDTEVVYYTSGRCVLEVNQDNLRLGSQYMVFGVPSNRHTWPSLTASALPIPNDKRILRAVKKVLCEGCAKPPSIEGLENVKVEEGSKARFRCHLAGYPIPWVEWFKDGKKITTRGRIRVKTKRRTSRLVIRRSRVSDRGVYECRAGNVVQKEPVSASASLVVTRKRRKTTTAPATTTPLSTSTSTQSSPWTTEPCREIDFCNNGGTCIFYKDVQEYVCHCAEGYVGLRCDYKDVRVSVGEIKNYSSRGAIP